MKKFLVSLLFACSVTGVQANTPMHLHPSVGTAPQTLTGEKTLLPGFCDVELINQSFTLVDVYGTFDDGAPMRPFTLYPGSENRQYISLYYASPGQPAYCHSGIYLSIFRTEDNYPLYNAYTSVHSTIYVTSYFNRGQSQKPEIRVNVK